MLYKENVAKFGYNYNFEFNIFCWYNIMFLKYFVYLFNLLHFALLFNWLVYLVFQIKLNILDTGILNDIDTIFTLNIRGSFHFATISMNFMVLLNYNYWTFHIIFILVCPLNWFILFMEAKMEYGTWKWNFLYKSYYLHM